MRSAAAGFDRAAAASGDPTLRKCGSEDEQRDVGSLATAGEGTHAC
jgi:hypothetical protein